MQRELMVSRLRRQKGNSIAGPCSAGAGRLPSFQQRKDTGVSCRLHDLRHTFATRLAENGVSESTMLALIGHMSRSMLERYSHIRMTAKRGALAGIMLRPVIAENEQNSEVVPVKVPVVEAPALIQ